MEFVVQVHWRQEFFASSIGVLIDVFKKAKGLLAFGSYL